MVQATNHREDICVGLEEQEPTARDITRGLGHYHTQFEL